MNHVERVRAAVAHCEPDRVPWGEFWLEKGLIKKILPGVEDITMTEEILAMEKLKMDLRAIIPAEIGRQKAQEGSEWTDCWGRKYIIAKGHQLYKAPAIADIYDCSRYVFPKIDVFDYSVFRAWRAKAGFFLFALLDGIFQGVASLLDFNQFLMATVKEPTPVCKLADRRAEFLVEQAQKCIAAGAHGILIGDDIAYNGGTYISPQTMREVFFPRLRTAVREIQKLGVPVFLHSDGNLKQVLADLVEVGLDGLHSLEPGAGMDIFKIKQEYGTTFCLMGNLDLGLLSQGEPQDITAACTELLQKVAPGGGYILSSASGILDAQIPLENVLAVSKAVVSSGNNRKQFS